MHTLRQSPTRVLRLLNDTPRIYARFARLLTTSTRLSENSQSSSSPWFVDPEETAFTARRAQDAVKFSLSRQNQNQFLEPIPDGVTAAIRHLHSQLAQSPLLEPSSLIVCEPIHIPPGPPLPEVIPKGRRRRGRTYGGEGVSDYGGIWNWVVIAQVKEGTEKRGAIESTVRLVRQALLTMDPPVTLPKKTRRSISDGWAMVDAGDFAVHVFSRDSHTKFFVNSNRW